MVGLILKNGPMGTLKLRTQSLSSVTSTTGNVAANQARETPSKPVISDLDEYINQLNNNLSAGLFTPVVNNTPLANNETN